MMMEMTMNGVLVRMRNGDTEHFKTATEFRTDCRMRMDDPGPWLSVLQGDVELGCFPPGSWDGARYFEGHVPPQGGASTQSVTDAVITKHVKHVIDVASAALGRGDEPPAGARVPA
jgi:hypothetical protein